MPEIFRSGASGQAVRSLPKVRATAHAGPGGLSRGGTNRPEQSRGALQGVKLGRRRADRARAVDPAPPEAILSG